MEKTELIKYSIKETSEMLKVSKRTLHHYEEKFDLPIQRDISGNRIYSDSNIELLEKIIHLKNKGMTLDGIKAMFEESGIINTSEKKVIVMDEKSLEIKSLLMDEIKKVISEQIQFEMQDTKDILKHLLNENIDLKQEILSSRQLNEKLQEKHFQELDSKLTSWREKESKKPWYKFWDGK